MRASHIILSLALLATPSVGYSQDSGLVSGRVDQISALHPPNPALPSRRGDHMGVLLNRARAPDIRAASYPVK